jgi:hypothetical protein
LELGNTLFLKHHYIGLEMESRAASHPLQEVIALPNCTLRLVDLSFSIYAPTLVRAA